MCLGIKGQGIKFAMKFESRWKVLDFWSRFLSWSLGFMPTKDWTCLTFTTCLSLHFLIGKMGLIGFFRCHLKLLLQEYFIKPVQFSRSVVSDSCASSRWCHPAISSSVVPFSSCPNPSQHQGLFLWFNSLHEVAKVLEFQLQHQSFQWTPRTELL